MEFGIGNAECGKLKQRSEIGGQGLAVRSQKDRILIFAEMFYIVYKALDLGDPWFD